MTNSDKRAPDPVGQAQAAAAAKQLVPPAQAPSMPIAAPQSNKFFLVTKRFKDQLVSVEVDGQELVWRVVDVMRNELDPAVIMLALEDDSDDGDAPTRIYVEHTCVDLIK